MKIFISIIIISLFITDFAFPQEVLPEPIQTWISGSGFRNSAAIYGEKGVSNENAKPGGRSNFAYWTDLQGNFWVFGGVAYGNYDNDDQTFDQSLLNDLWKYDIVTETWIWMGGSKNLAASGTSDPELWSNYGDIGVSSETNWPGARSNTAFTTGADGNLYLFGGNGFQSSVLSSRLNELWKYDINTNEWTFLSGKTTYNNSPGIYGIKNVENASNEIPAKIGAGFWSDQDNNLYVFGGYGFTETALGNSNDLWKYNTLNGIWTWIGGTKLTDDIGVYGTKGIASINNIPPARFNFAYGKVAENEIHLFGGVASSIGVFNDVWKYEISSNRWTWVNGSNSLNDEQINYGEKGVGSDLNALNARSSMGFATDYPNSDNPSLFVFGGYYFSNRQYNDLWKYDTANEYWVWVGGSAATQSNSDEFMGVYGTIGVYEEQNNIPHRSEGMLSIVGNEAKIFGGLKRRENRNKDLNDLWNIDLTNFQDTWIAGDSTVDNLGVFGPEGVNISTVSPGARLDFGITNDANNHIWLYGGLGFDQVFNDQLADLWKFDTATETWLWVDGTKDINVSGDYATELLPGSRAGHIFEGDSENNLWLIGGYSLDANQYLSDVWKYDINNGIWNLMKGDATQLEQPVYGVQGVPAEMNTPGARTSFASAIDENNNIWLFGGARAGSNDSKNDLWKFNTQTLEWTWVSGVIDNIAAAIPGELGQASEAFMPGGRKGATISIRGNQLIIFGGSNGNNLNDLWIYDISNNTWAWHYGDTNPTTATQQDSRVIRGVEGNGNLVGTRNNATSIIDQEGFFWIFGTTAGFTANETFWKFNPSNGLWTWMAGKERFESYGSKGVAAKSNQFPRRSEGKVVLQDDQVYYFGGRGWDRATQQGWADDFWRFDLLLQNNVPTDILLSQQSILENQPEDVLIGEIIGVDDDENELLSYELVEGEGDAYNGSFYLVNEELYASSSFNFEETPQLSLRIRVIDKGNLFFEKALTILVGDQPDAPTDLLIETDEVQENLPIGTIVSSILATDEDANEQLTFELVEGIGALDNDKFAINSGQIVTNQVFDFETIENSQLGVRVEVSDKYDLRFQKTLTINVVDVNDTPTDLLVSNTTINENEPENTLIGNLTAIDQDEADDHSFEILASSTNEDYLKFSILNNEVRTSEPLNFEEKSSYSINIRTTDLAGEFFDKNFEITVENVSESPTDVNLAMNTIQEGAQIGTLIGDFLVEDEDLNESHSFSFIGGAGSTDNSRFNIVDDKLFSAEVFNIEESNSFSVRIRVTDSDDLSFDKILTVNVINVNEAPTSIELSIQSIEENLPSGNLVGILTNNDPDLNDSFTYELVDLASFEENVYFEIVENRLETAEMFDYESELYGSKFNIRIQVTDAEGLSHTQNFEVDLIDVNEAPSDLVLSITEIQENVGNGSLLGLLSHQDEDANENHSYQLMDLSVYPDNENFVIEDNQVKLAISPNFEQQSSHEIKLLVSDKGGLSFDSVFVISILDINEAPSDIELSNQQIAENQSENSLIGLLSVIDEDFDDLHTLTFESGTGGADNSFFSLNDGQLLANQSFDFEEESHSPLYSIRIKATDAGGLSFIKVFSIEILDEMEAPSSILLSNSSIDEVLPPSTLVGVFQTLDSDDPNGTDTYTYEIIPHNGSNDHNFFKVEGDELQSAQTLFFANQSSYTLKLQSTDPDGLSFQQVFDIELIPIIDSEAPTIENLQIPTNNVYLSQSNSGEISFTVSDNYWIEQVQLYHKQLNESQFSIVDFDTDQTGTYNFPLSNEIVGTSGLMFYVQALDSVNNISRTANQYIYVRYAEDDVPTINNLGNGGGVNDYRMFSIPFDLEDSRVDNIFAPTFGAYNQEVWRVFHFDNGRYLEFQAGLTNIEKGKGYWFNSRRAEELNLNNVQFPAYTNELPFQMSLRQGWNQIGNPYNFEIDWNQVLNQNGVNNQVGNLKLFNGEGYVDDSKLQAFEGAFVFADDALVLNIPLANDPSTTRMLNESPNKLDWQVDFSLEIGDRKSNPLQIGMLELGHLAKKAPTPPKFIEYIELASIHPDHFWQTYERDHIDFKIEHSWTLEINQNIAENSISTLKWSISNSFAPGQLMLIDENSNQVIDMHSQNQIQFRSLFQKRLRVFYNDNGVKDFELPLIQVGNVFPNPLDNFGMLPILLPESKDKYHVELRIFDNNGQQIGSHINFMLEYGAHQLPIGQSHLPAGMYHYRLKIQGDQQELFSGKFSKR